MPISLTFLCSIAGGETSRPLFGDVAVREHGPVGADAVAAVLPRYSMAVRAPSLRCARTAHALALTTEVEPALRDFDYGEWRGRTAAEVAATDPYGLSALLTDPDAVPHGSESVRQFCRRVANWLDGLPPHAGRVVAVTEPAVIRAALVHALSEPVSAFWHVTVAPSTTVCLSSRNGRWHVRLGPTPRAEPGRLRATPVARRRAHRDPLGAALGSVTPDAYP
ncbi:histidine phosphatase family protein [Streptomyces sp. M2CJ-2]|uniref:histidine phosphatase family protein n=1 Tax=Streptomyces sp. M2CJ-2 TaxID=2803948 RepID=UPI00192392EB|nr:histidine phosphatase family protein [Streptomyces sp. M2CJ-2]MBL3664914.1 histidine phosphatase family protein [Streptomyces sp. M2CJ-2]